MWRDPNVCRDFTRKASDSGPVGLKRLGRRVWVGPRRLRRIPEPSKARRSDTKLGIRQVRVGLEYRDTRSPRVECRLIREIGHQHEQT